MVKMHFSRDEPASSSVLQRRAFLGGMVVGGCKAYVLCGALAPLVWWTEFPFAMPGWFAALLAATGALAGLILLMLPGVRAFRREHEEAKRAVRDGARRTSGRIVR